jgi:predicted nucleic acid-binding Zn ribbon protein
LTKEELIATLLSKKEAKLRECALSIQQKEAQFATQLEQMQSAHEQEVATIKQEVQGVL